MNDSAQFVSEIKYALPYGDRDMHEPRSGVLSRHMCNELNGICRYPMSYGIRIVGQDASLRYHDTSLLVLRACAIMKGALIAAGGSVLSMLEKESGHSYILYDPSNGEVAGRSYFASSDVDFYVRANSPEARRAVVAQVLQNVMPPVGKVVRTHFALSWEAKLTDVYGEWHKYSDGAAVLWHNKNGRKVVKVQIINLTLPCTDDIAADINLIFNKYDLDCCKWALDHRGLYCTKSSLNALFTRICRIPYHRVTDSLIPRMARYLKRCYDFEIDPGYYPKAYEAVVGMLRTGKATTDVSEFPLSGYDMATICERDRNIMLTQLKSYGAIGKLPHAICALPTEAILIVNGGKQRLASGYYDQWNMKMLNRMCELITWMAISSPQDSEAMQFICIRTLDAWKVVIDALDLQPMFDTVPPFNKVSIEVLENYWQPTTAKKRNILII